MDSTIKKALGKYGIIDAFDEKVHKAIGDTPKWWRAERYDNKEFMDKLFRILKKHEVDNTTNYGQPPSFFTYGISDLDGVGVFYYPGQSIGSIYFKEEDTEKFIEFLDKNLNTNVSESSFEDVFQPMPKEEWIDNLLGGDWKKVGPFAQGFSRRSKVAKLVRNAFGENPEILRKFLILSSDEELFDDLRELFSENLEGVVSGNNGAYSRINLGGVQIIIYSSMYQLNLYCRKEDKDKLIQIIKNKLKEG